MIPVARKNPHHAKWLANAISDKSSSTFPLISFMDIRIKTAIVMKIAAPIHII
ncbi:hypothetical protein D3C80_1937750 [compost metagenome]